jgi:hypothetical protein
MPASAKAEEMETRVRQLLGVAAAAVAARSAAPAAVTVTGA